MQSSFWILACIALAIFSLPGATGQEMESRQVVVRAEAEELPSAYGAPPDLSHGRISTLTKSYVLSPFSLELEAGYEGDIFRHALPAQLFWHEIEMGLPGLFTVGAQCRVRAEFRSPGPATGRKARGGTRNAISQRCRDNWARGHNKRLGDRSHISMAPNKKRALRSVASSWMQ